MKILYIAGYGRSGTTLLDNTLAAMDGFFTVGEMRYLWDRGIQRNWTCGCRESFSACEFWPSVLAQSLGTVDSAYAEGMLVRRDPLSRLSHAINALRMRESSNGGPSNRADYIDVLGRLYRTIEMRTQADVIIDSSKWPSYGRDLAEIPGASIYVVHLVRDPRAVVHSWKRKKAYDPYQDRAVYVPRYPAIRTVLEWVIWNISVDRFRRSRPTSSLLLRYEDFSRDPAAAIGLILGLIGCHNLPHPIRSDRTVLLKQNHAIAGNPLRFARGSTRIKPDLQWRAQITRFEDWMVRAIAGPVMRGYGYEPGSAIRTASTLNSDDLDGVMQN